MAHVRTGNAEAVFLCAADYLTGEVLIRSLVHPTEMVVDWRTEWSGVTQSTMNKAIARSQTLNGWEGARNELWRYIDADTMLVGHALQHDLSALRMIHTKVVDSAILTKNALGPKSLYSWSLKRLCIEFLGVEIQSATRLGHDCREDTLAAREVVLWCCRHPQELRKWGTVKREQEVKELEVRKISREKWNLQQWERIEKRKKKRKERLMRKERQAAGQQRERNPYLRIRTGG